MRIQDSNTGRDAQDSGVLVVLEIEESEFVVWKNAEKLRNSIAGDIRPWVACEHIIETILPLQYIASQLLVALLRMLRSSS